MKALFPILAALALGGALAQAAAPAAPAAARPASFAGFSIQPAGPQRLNFDTGVVTLPQGGTAADNARGVQVQAGFIEYKDGEFLTARNATMTLQDGGRLTAPHVRYDAQRGVLQATGGVGYSDAQVQGLRANTVFVNAESGLVVLRGGVSAQRPAVSANSAVIDPQNSRALLYGNYRYVSGQTRLQNARPDAALLVTLGAAGTRASTNPPASILNLYLPLVR